MPPCSAPICAHPIICFTHSVPRAEGALGDRFSMVHGTYSLPEPLRALGVDLEGRVAWARVVALNIGGIKSVLLGQLDQIPPLEVRESADHGTLVSKGMNRV